MRRWCQLILVANAIAATPNKLTIIHTNDIHSHYDPTNSFGTDCTPLQIQQGACYGGIARLSHLINKIRENQPHTLLLDGGDQFQGTMYYTYFKGNATFELMNQLKYDAMSIGNHEFDSGVANLARVIKRLNFPVICANIDSSSQPELEKVIKPYIYLPEYELAIIGYISETTGRLSNTGALKFLDPVPVVQKVIDELKSKGIHRIIALSHNGYKEDIDLASQTRGLSLIVGGHSHSYLGPSSSNRPRSFGPYPTATTNLDNEKVYVVQAYCWGRFLGYIELDFRPDGYLTSVVGAPIELTMDVPEDPLMNKTLQTIKNTFESIAKKKIGVATRDFNLGHCPSKECAMGNLLTDSMLVQHQEIADISIFNSGGIRATFSEGPITMQDVLAVLPFDNYVVQFPIQGHEIWSLITSVLKKYSSVNSLPITSFIQVSGLQFTYCETPLSLIEVKVYNRTFNQMMPIQFNQTYNILTADFLASGGDNIFAPPRTQLIRHELQNQGLINYITKFSPLSPSLSNRIILSKTPSFNSRQQTFNLPH